VNSKQWKNISLQVGDMVVKYDNGTAEQGILHRRQPQYYDQRKEQTVGPLWAVLGWQSRILESFLKKKIYEERIKHYPVRER